jgi:predicted nucleotidyltransferase
MPQIPLQVSKALDDVARWVRGRFGERVTGLSLFGSFARGEGSLLESDVDLLILVRRLTEPELVEIVNEVARLSCEHNILVSPLAMAHERFEEMRADDRLLTREIDREGVPL